MVSVPSSLRERRVFADSGAYLALLDRNDANHAAASAILTRLAEQRFRHNTSNAVIIESHALVLSSMGIRVASQFLRGIEASNTVVVRCRAADESIHDAWEWFREHGYVPNHPPRTNRG